MFDLAAGERFSEEALLGRSLEGDGPDDPWWSEEVLAERAREVPPEPPGSSEVAPSGFSALELDIATGEPGALSDVQVLDGVVGLDRVVAWAQARQARLLAEFLERRGDAPEAVDESRPSTIMRFAPDEVGVALRISRGAAMGRLYDARYLVTTLPDVLDGWAAGRLDAAKVRVIVEAVVCLPAELAAAVAARVLPKAPEQSTGQLRAALAKAIIAVDPDGANIRHRTARRDRRVSVSEQPEGMASLWAYLSAPDARSAWEWLTRLARGLGKDDPRRMDARRADLLTALLTGRITFTNPDDEASERATGHSAVPEPVGTVGDQAARQTCVTGQPGQPGTQRPARERLAPVTPGKPLVNVVVPYSTLTGADQQPCELVGYGPIPADLAREIAADAVWKRLVTDPLSGTVLDHGRTIYHPPVGLADHVRSRDQYCRGPRCRRPATTSELDHYLPYPEGPTSEQNLWAACKHDHDLKHHGGWQVVLHPDGSLEWITPTGYRHTTHPHDYGPIDHESGLPEPQPEPPPDAPTPAEPDVDPPPF